MSALAVLLIVAAVAFLVLERIGHHALTWSTRSPRDEAIVATSQDWTASVDHRPRRPAPARNRQRVA